MTHKMNHQMNHFDPFAKSMLQNDLEYHLIHLIVFHKQMNHEMARFLKNRLNHWGILGHSQKDE